MHLKVSLGAIESIGLAELLISLLGTGLRLRSEFLLSSHHASASRGWLEIGFAELLIDRLLRSALPTLNDRWHLLDLTIRLPFKLNDLETNLFVVDLVGLRVVLDLTHGWSSVTLVLEKLGRDGE